MCNEIKIDDQLQNEVASHAWSLPLHPMRKCIIFVANFAYFLNYKVFFSSSKRGKRDVLGGFCQTEERCIQKFKWEITNLDLAIYKHIN